ISDAELLAAELRSRAPSPGLCCEDSFFALLKRVVPQTGSLDSSVHAAAAYSLADERQAGARAAAQNPMRARPREVLRLEESTAPSPRACVAHELRGARGLAVARGGESQRREREREARARATRAPHCAVAEQLPGFAGRAARQTARVRVQHARDVLRQLLGAILRVLWRVYDDGAARALRPRPTSRRRGRARDVREHARSSRGSKHALRQRQLRSERRISGGLARQLEQPLIVLCSGSQSPVDALPSLGLGPRPFVLLATKVVSLRQSDALTRQSRTRAIMASTGKTPAKATPHTADTSFMRIEVVSMLKLVAVSLTASLLLMLFVVLGYAGSPVVSRSDFTSNATRCTSDFSLARLQECSGLTALPPPGSENGSVAAIDELLRLSEAEQVPILACMFDACTSVSNRPFVRGDTDQLRVVHYSFGLNGFKHRNRYFYLQVAFPNSNRLESHSFRVTMTPHVKGFYDNSTTGARTFAQIIPEVRQQTLTIACTKDERFCDTQYFLRFGEIDYSDYQIDVLFNASEPLPLVGADAQFKKTWGDEAFTNWVIGIRTFFLLASALVAVWYNAKLSKLSARAQNLEQGWIATIVVTLFFFNDPHLWGQPREDPERAIPRHVLPGPAALLARHARQPPAPGQGPGRVQHAVLRAQARVHRLLLAHERALPRVHEVLREQRPDVEPAGDERQLCARAGGLRRYERLLSALGHVPRPRKPPGDPLPARPLPLPRVAHVLHGGDGVRGPWEWRNLAGPAERRTVDVFPGALQRVCVHDRVPVRAVRHGHQDRQEEDEEPEGGGRVGRRSKSRARAARAPGTDQRRRHPAERSRRRVNDREQERANNVTLCTYLSTKNDVTELLLSHVATRSHAHLTREARSMTTSGGKRVVRVPDVASAGASERILALLQLNKVAIVDQLALSIASFRPAQAAQLLALLDALHATGALEPVAAHFDRKLDVKDEMERYLHDILKMHHYISHHDVDTQLTSAMLLLYGAFGDGSDRQLLTKVFRTLGFALSSVFCVVCSNLSLRYQQELLTLFADALPELRAWMHWLSRVRNKGGSPEPAAIRDAAPTGTPASFEDAVQFFVKTVVERCTMSWLTLLRPLPRDLRLSVVCEVHRRLPSTSLKQLARFYETSGSSLRSYLALDPAVRLRMAVLLDEFPTATLQTLLSKFNSARLVRSVLAGLKLLPKRELLRLVDALGIADVRTVDIFASALFEYKRLELFAPLFLSFSTQIQLHFLELLVLVATTAETAQSSGGEHGVGSWGESRAIAAVPGSSATVDTDDSSAAVSECDPTASWLVFDLFLDAHFNAYDVVIQKLATLPSASARDLIVATAKYSPEELSLLGEGIESVSLGCLVQVLTVFAALPPESRKVLVQWVREVPRDEAAPIYGVLLAHLLKSPDTDDKGSEAASKGGTGDQRALKILDFISTLSSKDKRHLCVDILVSLSESPSREHRHASNAASPPEDKEPGDRACDINDAVLQYLCACALPAHKAVKLFRSIPEAKYDTLIFLLRTQRLAEQVALSRLMLSLPVDANCRLLDKVQSLVSTDTLDLFFELLLLIPHVEYRLFAKLLVSPNVSSEQLRSFVEVAASLMNQASSRELVIFTAELPVLSRNLFFDMLADDPVKGVLLRIVACSSRLPPELLHEMIALLHPLSWGTRSSLVEQIRVLDESQDVQNLANVARDLEPNDLQTLVLLFNLLQVSVRISFTARFLLLSGQEKHAALAKLNALPKATLQSYCSEVCDPRRPSSVGSSFFRVLGLLDSAYQSTLLLLVQTESSWPLISLLADCVLRSPDPSLLNGFAASLAQLTHETAFLALRSVVESALVGGTSLSELVVVFCHFRTPATLLEFLTFVQHLSRFSRSAVLFRVLSTYKQTVFLYTMCRMLDPDDALFALRRLDRLWQRHHEALDTELESLSARWEIAGSSSADLEIPCTLGRHLCHAEGVKIKDAFCNVVLGFRELEVRTQSDDLAPLQTTKERVLAARYAPSTSASTQEPLSPSHDHEDDNGEEDDAYRTVLFLPATRSLVPLALSLERHLQRTQSDSVLAQRSTPPSLSPDRINARFINIDTASTLSTLASSSPEIDTDDQHPRITDCAPDPSVFALTESTVTLPPILSTRSAADPVSPETTSARDMIDPGNADTSRVTNLQPRATTELPVLVVSPTQVPAILSSSTAKRDNSRPPSVDRAIEKPGSDFDSSSASALTRSESAPATFASMREFPANQKARRYRALAAALDAPSDFHVSRDRGASIFQKECEAVEAGNPTRIRVSKSLTAQTRVLEVRVQRALGKRDPKVHSQLASPLLRPDRHTLEQASAALALATRAREADVHGFCRPLR
ncbi:hypothetical protein PybrP1_011201, partial [[Pythium] brassicae (nom. inval.)]